MNPAFGTATIIRGDALYLPIADESVDLIVTSPPYFGLRSYQDGGVHYAGQLGSEATSTEFVAALIAATAEMVRVLKPSGSVFINLGDKYAGSGPGFPHNGTASIAQPGQSRNRAGAQGRMPVTTVPTKSLIGVPWRYALACIDDLGLILRAEIIWAKPNGLPESVTDRVRRSHEQLFHFTKEPRYYSAVDEIREEHAYPRDIDRPRAAKVHLDRAQYTQGGGGNAGNSSGGNPLGKLPSSVWSIASQPLVVPASLGVDHYASFPMELPRRIIRGWSPPGVCRACGEGRRLVVDRSEKRLHRPSGAARIGTAMDFVGPGGGVRSNAGNVRTVHLITGYACACPDTTAPTTPAVILDPFGGTGTTALVAKVLGRNGSSVDMSADYCRLATWRTTDPGEIARAMEVPKPAKQVDGQADLFAFMND